MVSMAVKRSEGLVFGSGARRPSAEEAGLIDDAWELLRAVDPGLPEALAVYLLDDPIPAGGSPHRSSRATGGRGAPWHPHRPHPPDPPPRRRRLRRPPARSPVVRLLAQPRVRRRCLRRLSGPRRGSRPPPRRLRAVFRLPPAPVPPRSRRAPAGRPADRATDQPSCLSDILKPR